MKIGLTCASGKLGRAVASHLMEMVPAERVALITRDPAALQSYAEAGASVRFGDFAEPETLSGAVEGIDRLLIISTHALGVRVEQHRAMIDAAAKAGVGHLLYTSWVNPQGEETRIVAADHAATEKLIEDSDANWTILRHCPYADVYAVLLKKASETGAFLHNHGTGLFAPVARDNCAAVAAHILARGGHVGERLIISGPALLSATDMANAAEAVWGRPVKAIYLSDDDYVRDAQAHYLLPAGTSLGLGAGGRGIRAGELAGWSSDVEMVTGRRATTLEDLLRAGKPEW